MRPGVDRPPVIFVNQPFQLHLLGIGILGVINRDVPHVFLVGSQSQLIQLLGGAAGVINLRGDKADAALVENLLGDPQGRFHRRDAHIKGHLDENLDHLGRGQAHIQGALNVAAQQGQLPHSHQRRHSADAALLDFQPGPVPDGAEQGFVHDAFQVRGQQVDAGQGKVAGVAGGHHGPHFPTPFKAFLQRSHTSSLWRIGGYSWRPL